MKQFYILRISCLLTSFILVIFSATATPPWHIISTIAATTVLLLGLIYEISVRYNREEKQKIKLVCRELVILGITFFVTRIAIEWFFEKVIVLNNLYRTARTLNTAVLSVYFYYLCKEYLESRKNKAQKEPITVEETDTIYKNTDYKNR